MARHRFLWHSGVDTLLALNAVRLMPCQCSCGKQTIVMVRWRSRRTIRGHIAEVTHKLLPRSAAVLLV
eukprot:COSAG03_NODE_19353_length_338_cov_1.071130_1_plen_68_part_00